MENYSWVRKNKCVQALSLSSFFMCVMLCIGDTLLSLMMTSNYSVDDENRRYIGLTNASPEKANVADGFSWRWNNGTYSNINWVIIIKVKQGD